MDLPSAPLRVGDIVADRYRVDAMLGEGGMGIVYRAEHLHLHKSHALKVLLPSWTSTPEVVARFEREAVAAGNIESPHVAAATDSGRLADGSLFLVMEYVDGHTLRSALEGGAFSPERALHILRGIVGALTAAHALGIVHRDLKPENVMLVERDGDPDFVKVLDFGIAKVVGPGSARATGPPQALTKVGAVLGTPDYMSPEQALGQAVDARSDLYSSGVILFEMLTGKCPFDGGAMTVLRQHVMDEVPELPASVLASAGERVEPLLRRLLAKAPENRFATATELSAALDECARPREEAIPRAPRPSLTWVRARIEALLAGLAEPAAVARMATPRRIGIAGVSIAILIAAFLLLLSRRGPPPTETATPTAGLVTPPATPVHSGPAADEVPLVTLPPPPAPSSAATANAASPSAIPGAQGRRTGPAGIYIPPPSQWFR